MSTKAQTAPATALATTTGRSGQSVLARIAERYGVEPGKLNECLKATAFKGTASNEQMMALLVVADQYRLNPFTKEIYAFPDKNNGIVPVVGVDGWARIVNEHPQFDGLTFAFAEGDLSCTCSVFRKDRSHPTEVTEYMDECKRNTGPWGTHPRRMLRHKAFVQAARLAFGFVGIYDEDEAVRVLEAKDVEVSPPRRPVTMPTLKAAPATDADATTPAAEPPAGEPLVLDPEA